MKLVTPSLVVENTDGFQNDVLNRQEHGKALLNLVSNSSEALVISLDGKWGEGKTTFVKMWQGLLNQDGIPNLYIDAFANDHIDDAFISIVSAITGYAEENIKKEKEDEIKELIEKSKKVGGKILSWSTRIAIKAVTLGIIKDTDIDAINEIKDEISESASDVIGDYVEERITAHTKDVKLIESFKELLSELPSKLTTNTEKPLVIIIDELDRCKPTFAVEVLEKIKHLFSVKNIIFFLVINKIQLEESIRCIYGSSIDAQTYLQKFIHLEFRLPKSNRELRANDYIKYIDKLFVIHELDTWGDHESIKDELEALSIQLDLSLRQLEKAFTNIAIYYSTSSQRDLRITPIIVTLSVLKVYSPTTFTDLLNRNCSYENLLSSLKISAAEQLQRSMGTHDHSNQVKNRVHLISNWMNYGLISESEFNGLPHNHELKIIAGRLMMYANNRELIIPRVAQRLSMFVTN